MTTMTIPAMTKRWDKIKELIDSMGLTIVSRTKTKLHWVIVFAEDLNPGQKNSLEARITHTISGIDWA